MKIIVTGGAGFIGSHVVDAYIKAGHKVVVIDDLSAGFRKNLNPKAKFYKADIRDATAMDRIFKKERPEIVNHHAAMGSVTRSVLEPRRSLETNVMGTANVLIAFANFGKGKNKKFIFSSSAGTVYGMPKYAITNEDAEKLPVSPYGESKLLDEEIIKFYARYAGFNYVIFRYPNPYGPRQDPKSGAGIVMIFSNLMKKNVRPTIFGDGSKTRDYVYIEDIARINLLALRKGKDVIVNTGSGAGTSDQMIYDTVARELGFKGKPIYAPWRKGEVYQIALDSRKAKRIFGWKPTVPLTDGIHRTMQALK